MMRIFCARHFFLGDALFILLLSPENAQPLLIMHIPN